MTIPPWNQILGQTFFIEGFFIAPKKVNVTVQAMKVLREWMHSSADTTSAIDGSELSSSSRHGRLALGERDPVLTEEKTGWAPEPVRALWRTEKSLYPTENRTTIPPSYKP